jgi:hypothetical protein
VVECDLCGALLSAADDDGLVEEASAHFGDAHADAGADEARVRGLVEREAYTATDS